MNELLNHLNNYAKKRKNKHRFSAVMVCLAVIVSFTVYIGLIEPAESASGQLACGMEEHEHTQDCFELICGFDDESEEEISVDTTEIGSEETTETTCETEETTTEKTETTTSTEAEETAPVHVHSDKCYRLICLTEAHLHKQDCYNQPVETTEPDATTETSASISTGTTMSTEQTTETTTTTTKLSEEVYELNAALFGELYMGRVSVLADETVETGYKFYYTGGKANQLYAHSYFGYHSTAIGEPTSNIVRTYNGNTYNYAYNFNGANSERFVSLNTQFNGTLILLWGEGDDFKVKVLNEATNQSTEKEFKTGYDGIMVVPVTQGVNYKITQSGGKSNARLVYAEFVPTVTPVDGGTYRIRNVKTGLYIEMGDIVKVGDENKQYIQQGGNTPSDDKRNDFKFSYTRDDYYQILPQRDTSKAVDYSKNDNILGTYTKRNYATLTENDKNKILNQEFKFVKNKVNDVEDGTYKIYTRYYGNTQKDDTYCLELGEDGKIISAIASTSTNTTNYYQDFIIVEATEMVKPEVVYPPATIDEKTYLIKNVRSRLYVHNDDGNIVQQKDVGADSQFKFISTGTAGEYYIVSADGKYALTTDQNITNGTDVKYSGFSHAENQKFYAEQMENGSIRFYQIDNNGKKFYLEIEGEAINDGAEVDLGEADKVKDNQCFFLVPVIEPVEVEEKHTRVEARVIFADYNDGKIDENTRNLYDEPAWIPTFSLYKNGNLEENKDGNLVVDVSSARKDWCYQYNYVWDLGESNTNDKYYVALNGVNNNQITLNGKTFNVYYLKDTELNHPGNNGNSNAPAEAYKQTPYSQAGDQIIYIFLDPVVEQWWGGTNPPGTFDLSMKKRWDGHNSDGFDNRKKEKIQIQLQKLVTENGVEKWVEYNPADLGENYRSIIYYEKNNISNNFVDKTFTYNNVPLVSADVPEDQRLTRVVPGVEGEVAWQTVDGDYVNKTVLEQAQGAKDGETVAKANRLELVLHYNEWNNVILSYDKGNKPSHFQEGYYMNWKALPYGNYRVIETMSFYDANENDVFDEGDRDTSNEYYYMSYPPMRDSRGVLHIQNFTKDMVLDIQKEWYDNTETEKMDNPGKTVKVNIYRSLEKIDDPKESNFGDGAIYSNVEVKDDNIILKTTDKHEKLLLKTTSEQKYYYYIQEVSVDGYKLFNGNDDNFVKSTNGKYYVDYEDGDGRKFILKNKADFSLNIEKKWYQGDVNIDYYNIEDPPIRPEFEIYKADIAGTPVVSTANNTISYAVEYTYVTAANTKAETQITKTEVSLELIGEAKVDESGNLKIIYNNNTTTTSVDTLLKTSKLDMSEIVEEVTPQTGFLNKKLIRDKNDNVVIDNNNYITIKKGGIFWAGTKNNDKRKGTLTIEVYEEDREKDIDIWFCDKGIHNDDIYFPKVKDYNGTIKFSNLNLGGNYRIRASAELRISKITFTLDNYYYIREKNSDSYTLLNGDDNGFVKNENGTYYTQITASNKNPTITAKNTADVEIDITKEWTPSNAEISKEMNFEIYKAYAQGTPVTDGEGYKVTVNNADYQLTKIDGTYKTNGEGNLDITNLPAFEEKDGTYHKLYYYVREIEGNYTTSDAINGFIPYESGQYGTAFNDTSSNSGKYNFVNTPKLEITVNKTWLDADGNTDYNNSSKEMKFILYRTTNDSFNPETDYRVGEYETKNLTKLIQNLDAYDSSGKKYNYYIVEISSDGNYSVDNYIVTYSETNVSWNKDGKQPVINVTNQAKPQNYELPETGGIGTLGYTVTGGAIILLSAMILLFKRRTQL